MWLSRGRSVATGVALPQLEPRAADLEPPVVVERESEGLPLGCRGGRVRREQRDVVEVELGVGLGLDEHELETLAEVDNRVAAVERGDAQADPLRARPARAALPRRRASACRGARRRRGA